MNTGQRLNKTLLKHHHQWSSVHHTLAAIFVPLHLIYEVKMKPMCTMKEKMHYFSMRQTSEYPAWHVTLSSQTSEYMIVLGNMSGDLFSPLLEAFSCKVEDLDTTF
jgi:hypothetical protein